MANAEALLSVPMSPRYSTLELAKNDATAGAPERDNAITAPEYNRDPDALQTAPGQGPQTFYDSSPPEAVETNKNRVSLTDASLATPPSRRLSPRALVIVTAIIAAVVVGSAVGIGVGVGLKQENSNRGSLTAIASTVTRTPSASPSGSVAPLLTNRRILDDTSIAALALPGGERRLFFQDQSGVIRQAVYSSSAKEWRADITYIVASDAKNYTPIAVINLPPSQFNGSFGNEIFSYGGIVAFYVSANNILACAQFSDGAWSGSQDPSFWNISQFIVAPRSRHLSVSVASGKPVSNILLVYESINDEIAVLNGSLGMMHLNYSASGPYISTLDWTWEPISNKFQASIEGTGFQFGAPFGMISHYGNNLWAYFEALFAGKHENGSFSDRVLSSTLYQEHGLLDTDILHGFFVPDLIPKADILLIRTEAGTGYGFWVNQGKLTSLSGSAFHSLLSSPSSPFPFSRLAGMSPANSTSFLVYHQLNASTFTEEEWDDNVGGWTPRHIAISMA